MAHSVLKMLHRAVQNNIFRDFKTRQWNTNVSIAPWWPTKVSGSVFWSTTFRKLISLNWPADKLWGDLADDPCRRAPALLSKSPCVMGQCGWSWGAIVGGAASVSKLGPVESAATGGPTRETVLLRGANTVRRGRVGRAAGGGTAKRKKSLFLFLQAWRRSGFKPCFKLRVVIDGRQCAFWRMPWRWHGLGVTRSRGTDSSRRGATWHLGQTVDENQHILSQRQLKSFIIMCTAQKFNRP